MDLLNRSLTQIDIDCVDAADTLYRISTPGGESDLCRSISEIGLLHPPFIIRKGTDSYRVVSGFKRIAACGSLGISSIPVFLLSEEIPRVRLAVMAISDNSLSRPLNPIEIARCLDLLSKTTTDAAAFRQAAQDAALPFHSGMISKLQSLRSLGPEVQQAVASGDIPVVIAMELARFGEPTAIRFSEIFADLKLSLNKQREVLLLCEEIGIREDRGILDVLTEPGLVEILDNPESDRNQKSRALRLYLRKRRFPSLCEVEAAYENAMKRLKLGEGIRLVAPKDFEGTQFSLSLAFETLEQLADRASDLERIRHDPALKAVLRASDI